VILVEIVSVDIHDSKVNVAHVEQVSLCQAEAGITQPSAFFVVLRSSAVADQVPCRVVQNFINLKLNTSSC
jgi:hypothetical protein